MSKHTPGPWKVVPSLNEIVNADHGLLRYDIRADYTLIGALYENEADARLIAAAPDLLAALKHCSGWVEAYGRSELRREVRAAITKATGGSDE